MQTTRITRMLVKGKQRPYAMALWKEPQPLLILVMIAKRLAQPGVGLIAYRMLLGLVSIQASRSRLEE